MAENCTGLNDMMVSPKIIKTVKKKIIKSNCHYYLKTKKSQYNSRVRIQGISSDRLEYSCYILIHFI